MFKEDMVVNGIKTLLLIKRALDSSRLPPEMLRARQEKGIRRLIRYAYGNVPLYRKLYDEAGFHPRDFHSLDDLEKIPLLTKERLKAASPKQRVVRGVDPSRCRVVRTSGATGSPLGVFLRPADERWQRAVAWRILFEHGYRLSFRTLQIDTTPRTSYFVQQFGIGAKDWLSPNDSPDVWIEALMTGRYEVLVATASVLHVLAEAVGSKRIRLPKPKIVVSDDESLMPSTAKLVKRAMGVSPVDVYGLCELSNFAWQCEERKGFHVSADTHIVEVAASPGETGRIIATDLGLLAMPIIRYDTGDLAVAAEGSCPCGRTLPLLKQIVGRAVDSVLLPSGRKLLWPFFYEVFSKYDELRRWRVLQRERDGFSVHLVLPTDCLSVKKQIREDLIGKLPEKMEVELVSVDEIRTLLGEKVRMVLSEVGASIVE